MSPPPILDITIFSQSDDRCRLDITQRDTESKQQAANISFKKVFWETSVAIRGTTGEIIHIEKNDLIKIIEPFGFAKGEIQEMIDRGDFCKRIPRSSAESVPESLIERHTRWQGKGKTPRVNW